MSFLFKSKFDISTILLYVIGSLGCLINHISLVCTRQP